MPGGATAQLRCPGRPFKGVGVSAEEARAVGERAVLVQLRDLECAHCGVVLLHVHAGTGGNNGDVDLAGVIQLCRFLGAHQVQRAVRAAQAALTVGHHGQVFVGSADPAVGAELPQCVAEFAGGIGCQRYGFAHCCEAAAAAAGCEGVLESQLGIGVDQAAGHDQVLGDPFAVDLFEVAQLSTGDLVQFLACDVVVDLR